MVLRTNVFVFFMLIFVTGSYAKIYPLFSPSPVQNSYYGWASATDGQTLVVGAYGEKKIYIYERNGLDWQYVTSRSHTADKFGYSVDIDGDTIVVGAYGYNSNQGAIYVFKKDVTNGWNVTPTQFSGGQTGDCLGWSVAIDGDTIVAGAYGADDDKGTAYVYEYVNDSWSFEVELYDPDGLPKGSHVSGARFGKSVAVDGDRIVVGAEYDYTSYEIDWRRGAACVFRRVGGLWGQSGMVKLLASDGQKLDVFGNAVAVSGDVIVVGCPYHNNGTGVNRGAAYVYRWNGTLWIEEKILIASEYANSSLFGQRLSLDGDRLVVGEYQSNSYTGSAYLFEWDGNAWSAGDKLISGGIGDYLGSSVAIAGDVIFVGACRTDGQIVDVGMVYVITLPSKLFNEFQVNTHINDKQQYPSIATDANGNFVVVWESRYQDGDSYGVYGQRFDLYGRRVGDEFQVNVTTSGSQARANVAMDEAGNFIIVWNAGDGDLEGIYARRYAANGTPLSGEILVNAYTISRQIYPTVALKVDGTFIVIWESFHGTNDWHIAGRLYDAAGNPITSEFDINQSGSCGENSLAISDTGDFTVAWDRMLAGYSICVRQYNANGTPKGNEVVLMTSDIDAALGPTIASDRSGNYVLAWHYTTEWPASEYRDIYAQRYDANFNPVGEEFMVNTTTVGVQQYPSIAMNSDGQFVIVWYGDTDDSEEGVFARQYDGNGQPVGNESQLNTYINGIQKMPVAAMQTSGRFIVAWQSEAQDGNDFGIFATIGPKTYLGDFNFNRQIDISDLQIMAEGWLSNEPVLDIAPNSGDGIINLLDFSVLAEHWFYE
jgi:hypothetical protein